MISFLFRLLCFNLGQSSSQPSGMDFVTSFAADVDFALDTAFMVMKGILGTDLPQSLRIAVIVAYPFSAMSYWILLSEGYGIRSWLQCRFCSQGRFRHSRVISIGLLTALSILLEDLPEVVLSILVDVVGGGELNYQGETDVLAVANIITAVYGIVIKVAEAVAARQQIVSQESYSATPERLGANTERIAEALRKCRQVTIEDCAMSRLGLAKLETALMETATLQKLRVARLEVHDATGEECQEAFARLAGGLAGNTTLEDVVIQGNARVGSMADKCPETQADDKGNFLGPAEARQLAEGARKIRSMRRLFLEVNHFGGDGERNREEAIRQIKALDWDKNKFEVLVNHEKAVVNPERAAVWH